MPEVEIQRMAVTLPSLLSVLNQWDRLINIKLLVWMHRSSTILFSNIWFHFTDSINLGALYNWRAWKRLNYFLEWLFITFYLKCLFSSVCFMCLHKGRTGLKDLKFKFLCWIENTECRVTDTSHIASSFIPKIEEKNWKKRSVGTVREWSDDMMSLMEIISETLREKTRRISP